MPPARPLAERFWEKVERWDPDHCWEWQATHSGGTGYGNIGLGNRKLIAHRVAYELCVGPIPAGLQIDHLCRNRNCVNPKHLEAVTQRVNIQRGLGNQYEKRTHCINGHPFDAANTRPRYGGEPGRRCLTCQRDIQRRRYARLREHANG